MRVTDSFLLEWTAVPLLQLPVLLGCDGFRRFGLERAARNEDKAPLGEQRVHVSLDHGRPPLVERIRASQGLFRWVHVHGHRHTGREVIRLWGIFLVGEGDLLHSY